jgi:protein-tyrosine phosphatase
MRESLELARGAVANGITHSVLTPHMHEGRYINMRSNLEPHLDKFRQALQEEAIPLQISLAAEVRIGIEVLMWLESEEVPFLGDWEGRKVMLMELPHGQIPPGTAKLVELLQGKGIQPMIAHPERNKHVVRQLEAIFPFVEMGCLFQVTSGSVFGQFGPYVQQRAVELLERGWVHILATDAHSMKWRPPNLAEGRAAAAEIVGEEESWALVRDRPLQIAASHFPDSVV